MNERLQSGIGRAVIAFHDEPDKLLEFTPSRGLVLPESRASKRFFLPSGVIVGRYGVTGYVLIDSRPEDRWVSYTNSDWTGVRYENPDDVKFGFQFSHPEKVPNLAHYLDTSSGFKMIRYFALPPAIKAFFERDRFLGDPLIDKCCQEPLPEDFDEEPAAWMYVFSGADFDEIRGMTDGVLLAANPHLTEEHLRKSPWRSNIYLSFHPWRDIDEVVRSGAESVCAAVANFDMIIERYDVGRQLPAREIRLSTGASVHPQLPPASE